MRKYTSIEICAGAGGQALGLEQAGFEHLALVEIDSNACATLRTNRPQWNVVEADVRQFSAEGYIGVDLLAGGVPCPPFSKAGKQLGEQDERDLFPEMIRLAQECKPKAILIENVRGLLDSAFDEYRQKIGKKLESLGYVVSWKLLQASDFGVPQLRPRTLLVALKRPFASAFDWPVVNPDMQAPTVGEILYDEMASGGWHGVEDWKTTANKIAPTIVGGSKKHGGPDLGPTRAKQAWASMGVDGKGIANEPPSPDFEGMPKLTVKMASILQGFPSEWQITGKKTPAYRQVGNAFPPPVAEAVGKAIIEALEAAEGVERGAS